MIAEAQALQKKPMYMAGWIKRLNAILTLNEREVLNHAGKITAKLVKEIAQTEFAKYKEQQKKLETQQSLIELEKDLKKLK